MTLGFCALVVAAGLLTLPWAMVRLPVNDQAVSVVVTLQVAATALTALLLVGRFLADGDRHRVVAAATFAGTSTVLVLYALAFPGVLSAGPFLGSGGAPAVWLWALYHVVFAVGLAMSTLAFLGGRTVPRRRRRRSWVATVGAAMAGALVVAVAVPSAERSLPPTISGSDYSAFTGGPGVIAAMLVAAAVVVSLRGTGPLRNAVPPVLMVGLVDMLLTLHVAQRYTVGWYVARVMFLLAVSAVLVSLLSDTIAAFKRVAEHADVMHRAARTDTLTGLPNRRVLTDEEPLLPGGAAPRSLALMDLDRFKDLNDTFGHAAGDTVLAAVAGRLRGQLRKDDLLVRWGGDEILLVSALPVADLARVLDRMRHVIADHPVSGPAGLLYVSISIGAAEIPAHGSLDSAFSNADNLLREAKRRGRDQVVLRLPG